MEIKCTSYHNNLNRLCKDVFADNLSEILSELGMNARFFMSSDIDTNAMVRINSAILDLVKNGKYRYMPVHCIGEAYTRGSMGELGGTTKFSVRNICIWLNEIFEQQQRISAQKLSQEDGEMRKQTEQRFRENKLRNNLYGTAFYRKIEWWCDGGLKAEDWERASLDKIVALLEAGHNARDINPSNVLR